MINPEVIRRYLIKEGYLNVALVQSDKDIWVIQYESSKKMKAFLYPQYETNTLVSKILVASLKQELVLPSLNLVLPHNKNICLEYLDNIIDIYVVESFSISSIKARFINVIVPFLLSNVLKALHIKAQETIKAFSMLNYQILLINDPINRSGDFEGMEDDEEGGGQEPLDLF